ncbi:MAG TPA: HD domain-containing phosphohydrolase [Burkholderiaceae bacterium]|nr:HD domain-containing phosphohydrolase [Burkholderiaceae bacterium]
MDGHAERALDPSDDAAEVARTLGDRRRLWRALNTGGVMSNQTLDYPGAMGKLNEALQLANELGDAECRAKTIGNIGVAHHNAAQYADSLEAYEAVVRLAEGNPALARPREGALTNIAYGALLVRDVARGIGAAEDALRTAAPPQNAIEAVARVQLEMIYVRLLIEVRQFDKAHARARIARQLAEESGSQFARNVALGAEAMAEIGAGAVDIGLTRLKRMVEEARHGPEGHLRDALLLSARGYQLAGQPDVSSLTVHEIMAINSRVRAALLKIHQGRHLRVVQREWQQRYDAAEAEQRLELDAQLASGILAQSNAEYLEKAALAAELFDDSTGFHVYRVGTMSSELAKAKGMDPHTRLLLEIAARQHDMGKLVVPESILNKPGRFTPEERAIMETHAAEGARLIREAGGGLPQMHIAEEIAHFHHEKFDGTGYPLKLKGSQIPLSARIVALADVFDALTHRRCYKEAWTITDALAEIKRGRGTHFDPELTDIFLGLVPKLIRETGDMESYLAAPGLNSKFIKDRAAINRELRGDDGVFDVRR